MKSILQSIKPQYCELIASGKKTVEVRKTRPKLDVPFKAYIYCTKDGFYGLQSKSNPALKTNASGKVIGEYVCDEIVSFGFTPYNHGEYMLSGNADSERDVLKDSCLSFNEMYEYIGEGCGYAWHISNLKIYDKPKELGEFHKPCKCLDEYEGEVYCDCLNCEDAGDSDYGIIACDRTITRPPQSWCYVEEV